MRCEDVRCQGLVALRRTGDACEWHCSRCALSGAVVGFRGSPFDFSVVADEDETERRDAVVYTRLDELECARKLPLAVPLRYLLAIAVHHQGYVTLGFGEEELAELTASLEDALPRAPQSDALLLNRLLARFDAALLALSSRELEPVTLH